MVEDALRAYMRSPAGQAGRRELQAMLGRWAQEGEGLGEEEALAIATEEVHAHRRERRSDR